MVLQISGIGPTETSCKSLVISFSILNIQAFYLHTCLIFRCVYKNKQRRMQCQELLVQMIVAPFQTIIVPIMDDYVLCSFVVDAPIFNVSSGMYPMILQITLLAQISLSLIAFCNHLSQIRVSLCRISLGRIIVKISMVLCIITCLTSSLGSLYFSLCIVLCNTCFK